MSNLKGRNQGLLGSKLSNILLTLREEVDGLIHVDEGHKVAFAGRMQRPSDVIDSMVETGLKFGPGFPLDS